MHPSAMNLGALFFQNYLADAAGKTVVDIGSRDVNGSLRQVCPTAANYIGVDFDPGDGVDVVLDDPYQMPFADASVDVVVCSSVFEHSQLFWLVYLELLRILKPDGVLYLNMPSNGYIHRYPVDCWRFYPDAGSALVAWAQRSGYNPVLFESFIANKGGDLESDPARAWNDFVAVFGKDAEYQPRHHQRILGVYPDYTNATCDIHSIDQKYSSATEDLDMITARGALLGEQQTSLVEARQCIAQAEAERAELSRLLDEARESLQQQTHIVAALRHSNSWRLTRPLRVAKRQADPVRQLALRVSGRVRAHGGVPAILSGSLRLLRREGALAVLRRIRSAWALPVPVQTGAQATAADIPVIAFDSISEGFTEHIAQPPIDPSVKLIAFYLPQFHPFAENDKWWGKGFTEWSNVAKARPNYQGHYQPHLPIHCGYYDLRVPQVMREQARLAKAYGVHGFNYYFYWFAGKILMDTPLQMMLRDPQVDMPFCLTWANENWTRRWDGQENEVLIAQEHSAEDSLAFIRHLLQYFADPRYIKVDGKPLLIVYRASIIPDMAGTARLWREEVVKHGLPGLYLMCAQTFGILAPDEFGFDASLEFPPHTTLSHRINEQLDITNPDYAGNLFSYDQVVDNVVRMPEPAYKLYRTAMLSWDNTARKQNNSHTFHGFSLLRYKQCLAFLCNRVQDNPKYASDEKLVFVNAWNEWAEGTHLEPDRKFGYGYLQATYDVLSDYDQQPQSIATAVVEQRNPLAAIVHLHYPEVLADLQAQLENLQAVGCDLYFTVTSASAAAQLRSSYPEAAVYLVENRGRDILPFIKVLAQLEGLNYQAICKLHGKKTVYRADGAQIRQELFSSLAGSVEQVATVARRFAEDPTLGLVVPSKYLIEHSDHNMTYNHQPVADACRLMGLEFVRDRFPAGSMYWFRPEALARLSAIEPEAFDLERGLCDGTMPHAIERVIALLVRQEGYSVERC